MSKRTIQRCWEVQEELVKQTTITVTHARALAEVLQCLESAECITLPTKPLAEKEKPTLPVCDIVA
eukprot:1648166-Amphidinium_carterae.1